MKLALIAALAAGIALRLLAVRGDLWFDEVWSLAVLDQLRARAGPVAMLGVMLFHDNTHPVNSLWLALAGTGAGPLACRLLSLLASLAGLALAAAIGWRRSALEGVLATLLVGLSYPLVALGTEARGYGVMMLAALLAFWAHDRLPPGTQSPPRAFIAAALLGLLAHYTFVFVLLGLGAWTAWRGRAEGLSLAVLRDRLWRFYRWPLAMLALVAAMLTGHLMIGGGEPSAALPELALLASLTAGLDGFAWRGAAGGVAAAAAVALAAIIWRLARARATEAAFFAVVVLAIPIGLVASDAVTHPQARYFLSAALFALLLAARALAALARRGRLAAVACILLLAGYTLGQAQLFDRFLGPLRGQYSAAVGAMLADGARSVAVEGGFGPNFRARLQLAHETRLAGRAGDLRLLDPETTTTTSPDWCLVETLEMPAAPAAATRAACHSATGSYRLAGSFPAWGLSGATWRLYRAGEQP